MLLLGHVQEELSWRLPLRICPTLGHMHYVHLHLTLKIHFTRTTTRKMNTVFLSKCVFPWVIYLKKSPDKV